MGQAWFKKTNSIEFGASPMSRYDYLKIFGCGFSACAVPCGLVYLYKHYYGKPSTAELALINERDDFKRQLKDAKDEKDLAEKRSLELLIEKIILAFQVAEFKERLKDYNVRVKELSAADKTVAAQLRCIDQLEEERDALSDKVTQLCANIKTIKDDCASKDSALQVEKAAKNRLLMALKQSEDDNKRLKELLKASNDREKELKVKLLNEQLGQSQDKMVKIKTEAADRRHDLSGQLDKEIADTQAGSEPDEKNGAVSTETDP